MDTLRLQVILDGIDRATKPLKGILKGTSALGKAAKETRDRLRDLNSQQKQLEGFSEAATNVSKAAKELQTARDRVRDLGQQIIASTNPTKKLTDEYRAATAELRGLSETHDKATAAQRLANADMQRAGIPVAELASRQRTLAQQIAATTAALERQGSQLNRVKALQASYQRTIATRDKLAGAGAATGAVGAATGMGVLATLKAYTEAEDAGTRLAASMMQVGGVVPAQYKQINDLATRLGDRLPGTTADYQNMMQMLIRQGMSAKSILGGLGEATAYLAVQLDMPKTAAAEFAAKLQDATRTTEGDMMRLMDVIQRTYYLGVDSSNMLQGFAKLSPALSVLRTEGLAAAQALAPLLVMADQSGMEGGAAGNAYRKIIKSAVGINNIKNANAVLGELGVKNIKLDFTDGKGEFGGLDNLFAQLSKLKDLNTQTREEVIRNAFGNDSETMQVLSLLIEKGKAGYEEVAAKMEAQANLQARVNAQLGTLRALWEATTGTFTNLLAALGESIAPQAKALTQWLGDAAAAVRQWAVDNPRLTSTLMQITALIAITAVGVGALLLAVSAVLGPFALFKLAVGAVGLPALIERLGALSSSLLPALGRAFTSAGGLAVRAMAPIAGAIAATPIGWIVGGLALLGAAALAVYKYWEPIKNFFGGFWDGLSTTAGPALAGLGSAVGDLLNRLWSLVALVSPIRVGFEMLGAATRPALDTIIDRVARVWDWLKKLLQPVDDVNGAARQMGTVWGSVLGNIIAKLAELPQKAAEAGALIISRMTDAIREKMAALRDLMSKLGQFFVGDPARAISPPVASQPPLRAGGGNVTQTTTNTITVNGAPGQSPADVARAVRTELDARDRQRQAQRRSILADTN